MHSSGYSSHKAHNHSSSHCQIILSGSFVDIKCASRSLFISFIWAMGRGVPQCGCGGSFSHHPTLSFWVTPVLRNVAGVPENVQYVLAYHCCPDYYINSIYIFVRIEDLSLILHISPSAHVYYVLV